MKMKLFTTALILLTILLSSCKKQEIETTTLASIQITNVVSGGGTLQFGTNMAPIANKSNTAYALLAGNRQLNLVTKDVPNTVYYDQTHEFVSGGVYSLFLTGVPEAVESVFIKDNIPTHVLPEFGIRFVNLSTSGTLVSVNLSGEAYGSQVPSLSYKAVSEFKTISANTTETSRKFEFRNAVTGALINSATVSVAALPRHNNITLVLAGTVGGEMVLRVNNY